MARSRTRSKKPRAATAPRSDAARRERILGAFSEHAKRSGLRAVVMGELATELRMSASTLYAEFENKEELVAAMVDRWCTDLATHDAIIDDERVPILERFLVWTDAWSERVVQYSPSFWSDLARDYPRQWALLQDHLGERKAKGAAILAPHLRSDVVPGVAFALLELVYAHAHDPRLADRLGIARRDAVRSQLQIWARGALNPPEITRPRRARTGR